MKFRHKSLMGLIYCCLLALPFVAILSRVIYVQSNKNAYQSYYGETVNNKEYISYNSYNEINEYTKITIETNRNITTFTNVNNNSYIEIKDLDNIDSTFAQGKTQLEENKNSIIYIYTLNNANNNPYLSFRTNSTNIITNIPLQDFTFSCTCTFVRTNDSANEMLDYIYSIEYNSYSYLDNVFEYSVNKFIENNNFGRINLFQWTTDLFFDSNNVNNMYVGFINWYLNYTMLVSTTYILFLVLMWFVNFARKLLERGMNYDW